MWQRMLQGAVLAVFCVAATLRVPAGEPVRTMDVGGLLLLIVPSLAAPWAMRVPAPVLAVTALAPVAYYGLGYQGIFAPAPSTAAVLCAVLLGRGAYAVTAASVVCLGSYAAGLGHGLTPGAAAIGPLWVLGWTVAAAAVGEALRKRRQLLEQERLRAEAAAERGAERERLRIARELHDSLTHSISVINVQAAVAGHLVERQPERIPDALETIRRASSDALRELRSTVEVLRRIDTPGTDPADEPGPSLERLEHLIEGARAAGVPVELCAEPTGRLFPDVDRAAYRIIQEALSNAAKHAPGAQVRVRVARRAGELQVTVTNGPARTAPPFGTLSGSGQGLIGMWERIALVGGTLHTGPHDGGFEVRATLPAPDTDDDTDGHTNDDTNDDTGRAKKTEEGERTA